MKKLLREKLVVEAIGRIDNLCHTRHDVILLNEAKKLVEGEKLTQLELEVTYAERYEGRKDLLPERYPELNGVIEIEKSKEYWGDVWEIVEPMIKSDSPKWSKVDLSGITREMNKKFEDMWG